MLRCNYVWPDAEKVQEQGLTLRGMRRTQVRRSDEGRSVTPLLSLLCIQKNTERFCNKFEIRLADTEDRGVLEYAAVMRDTRNADIELITKPF